MGLGAVLAALILPVDTDRDTRVTVSTTDDI